MSPAVMLVIHACIGGPDHCAKAEIRGFHSMQECIALSVPHVAAWAGEQNAATGEVVEVTSFDCVEGEES